MDSVVQLFQILRAGRFLAGTKEKITGSDILPHTARHYKSIGWRRESGTLPLLTPKGSIHYNSRDGCGRHCILDVHRDRSPAVA